ncbi:hypothetical protein JSQ73_005880 [Wolbachia endosymbiont of Anopheles demeilloni]|uniref:hypothetical protein n=1 Tax=Wolbachia endosymbiont of Anopheles demeilloni TaxID=2748871 RepID=UPI001BDB3949|nr:hypothetical protein [Wolbachia endosymbiont of Anopheles demeilloni]UIP92662.1 hypothetical protein JSQ73_005880 [Wolbachia endosymbiont of Anopheles demeilloni]
MNYNFSSSPRVGSCIPTRTACTTNPRYHHNFDPHCHNHFDPYCDGLELNIQLPDIKIPPCPEPKKSIAFSRLSIVVDAVSGEIKDAITKKSSGLMFAKCKEIIDKSDNNLEIGPDNLIKGQCDSNPECKACVDAINASIIDMRTESAFSPEQMSVPEGIVYII